MNILTLVWSIGLGGTERAAVNYAIAYKKVGVDSRVLVLGEGLERKVELLSAGVAVTSLVENKLPEIEVIEEFKTWMPDIIHIHNFSKALLGYIKKIKAEKTKIVETNVFSRPNYTKDYEIVDASFQLTYWGLWKYHYSMKGAKQRPVEKVVPYLVDTKNFKMPGRQKIDEFLSAIEIPKDAFIIGRIGQPHISKWDEKIIEVIEKTVKPGNYIYYLLVGLPGKIKIQIDRLPSFIRSRVKCIDEIHGDDQLSVYYHSLSLFAHISKIGESFGYVLAESMVCGTPVITLSTPLKDNGQFEVVGNNIGGFCVAGVSGFIKKINELYNDKNLLKDMKNSLFEWVDKRFAPEIITSSLITFYEALIKGTAKSEKINEGLIRDQFDLYGIKKLFLLPLFRLTNSRFFHKTVRPYKA